MCGIAGLLLSPQDLQHVRVDDMIKTLALEIESRGKDATGVARLTVSDRLRVTKTPETATEFFMKHPGMADGCRLALVHTRAWTTGTPKVLGNNHPITSGKITGIHNGVVQNDDALFAKFGWKRAAEVDSEAIFTAINNLGWREAMELLQGSIACAWYDTDAPGHLFTARHSSNPLNIGITESGSVIFASTNAAVAKAAAQLGSTTITIDSIKEGVMCEFWIDDDGKLQSNIEQFEPPKSIYARSGAWEYEQGAWFPSERRPAVSQGSTPGAATPAATSSANRGKDWGIGADGWVLKVGDDVVFAPNDISYEPMYGTFIGFGAKNGFGWVEFDFDFGVAEQLYLPIKQIYPMEAWKREPVAPVLQLPAVKVEHEIEPFVNEPNGDFYIPSSTEDLVRAVEDIFGEDALVLMPGYAEWERGELPSLSWAVEVVDGEIIDVEEAESNG